MPSRYEYRLIKSTWGIAIDITAEAVPLATYLGDPIEAAPGLWLAVETPALRTDFERWWLTAGLQLADEAMRPIVSTLGPLVVCVTDIWFVPTDYQEEGLALAMAGWLAQNFGLDLPDPMVRFDKQRNRYDFDFIDSFAQSP